MINYRLVVKKVWQKLEILNNIGSLIKNGYQIFYEAKILRNSSL
jgi:hypothetical protein